jgi:hypothetical protein
MDKKKMAREKQINNEWLFPLAQNLDLPFSPAACESSQCILA